MLFFLKLAKKEINHWEKVDPKKAKKIRELVRSIKLNPREGIGKPEHLKHHEIETWSRRIDQEHRLVYEIYEDKIIILSARDHYK